MNTGARNEVLEYTPAQLQHQAVQSFSQTFPLANPTALRLSAFLLPLERELHLGRLDRPPLIPRPHCNFCSPSKGDLKEIPLASMESAAILMVCVRLGPNGRKSKRVYRDRRAVQVTVSPS